MSFDAACETWMVLLVEADGARANEGCCGAKGELAVHLNSTRVLAYHVGERVYRMD